MMKNTLNICLILLFLRDFTQYESPFPHFRKEVDPDSKTLRFIVFRILDDGQCPEIR
jgi:hypothetical protein